MFPEDYSFNIRYTLGKGNVVADALSQRPVAQATRMLMHDERLIRDLESLDISCVDKRMTAIACLSWTQVQYDLADRIRQGLELDESI